MNKLKVLAVLDCDLCEHQEISQTAETKKLKRENTALRQENKALKERLEKIQDWCDVLVKIAKGR